MLGGITSGFEPTKQTLFLNRCETRREVVGELCEG